MQLWLEEPLPEPRSTARLFTFFHAAEVLDVLLNKSGFVGTEEFENATAKEHRQALSNLLALRFRTCSLSYFMIFAVEFKDYYLFVRDEIRTGRREPVQLHGVNRARAGYQHLVLLPRGLADEKLYQKRLPGHTWLIRAHSNDGWWVLSLNIARILKHRKWYRDMKKLEKQFGQRPISLPSGESSPIDYWKSEYGQILYRPNRWTEVKDNPFW